jgi:hypothetical protein
LELGEISTKTDGLVTYKVLDRWRRLGLIEKYFPALPVGNVPVEKWREFLGQYGINI